MLSHSLSTSKSNFFAKFCFYREDLLSIVMFYKKKFIFVKYNHIPSIRSAENRTEYFDRLENREYDCFLVYVRRRSIRKRQRNIPSAIANISGVIQFIFPSDMSMKNRLQPNEHGASPAITARSVIFPFVNSSPFSSSFP